METQQLKCCDRDGGCTVSVTACPLHLCPLPVVLQVAEYQGGPDWTGGVDRKGSVLCHQ